jgi:mono/diheme cytochrome c family protein
MRIVADALIFLIIAATVAFVYLTWPDRLGQDTATSVAAGDAQRGERIFFAGGCASCHAAPGAAGDEMFKLGGGLALKTPFGTFHPPNISMDTRNGIGGWSDLDFANALLRGISPSGAHYYPAFPYTSYTRMHLDDVADLWAFMKTLPPVDQENVPHELPLIFRLRRGIGLWKLINLSDEPIVEVDDSDEKLSMGRYLVEGPGHCGECHTPRNFIGGLDTTRWLAGAPSPDGKGRIPNITPHTDGLASWTAPDIAYALESGFTPEFDSLGSTMGEVQKNTARLSAADREAIAAYLKAIPAIPAPSRRP